MTGGTRACAGCQKYTALREKAKQDGNYSAAADYELLRRCHSSHDVPDGTARWGVPA
ncbi:hypothetical protein ACWY4P_32055 [Streptomyces sp. LZ34]